MTEPMTSKELEAIEAHPTFADIRPLIAEIKRLQCDNQELQYDKEAITKIWKHLGITNYEQAKWKSVDELVAEALAGQEDT